MRSMDTEEQSDTTSTRHRILQISLSLMSQRGVDGTSMRDLAAAAGLNVASLYHYFPSKRDLLEAVLVEQDLFPNEVARPLPGADPSPEAQLAVLLKTVLQSMFEVEEFVRLMVGEAMRAEDTAREVGLDLFSTFEASIEEWVIKNRPDLHERSGGAEIARLLCSMVVGIFVQRAAGVMNDDGQDLDDVLNQRAREAAQILSSVA